MIILELLQLDNWYGISHEVDIAKGINKLPETFKEGFEQQKRKRHAKGNN